MKEENNNESQRSYIQIDGCFLTILLGVILIILFAGSPCLMDAIIHYLMK